MHRRGCAAHGGRESGLEVKRCGLQFVWTLKYKITSKKSSQRRCLAKAVKELCGLLMQKNVIVKRHTCVFELLLHGGSLNKPTVEEQSINL